MKLIAAEAKALVATTSQALLRRFGALLLIAALCCIPLAGCANNSDSTDTKAQTSEAAKTANNSEATAEDQTQKTEEAVAADENATEITVTVEVTGDFEDASVDSKGEYTVADGASALDALQATDLDVTVEDSQYGAYVTSIDGLTAEGSNGWLYSVNGESPAVSAGDYKLADGDTVTWSFYVAE